MNPASPTPAHSYLPVPAASAKLKSQGIGPSAEAAFGTSSDPGLARFPPENANLSEQELDPYFTSFEASIKELEQLLTGPMEKVNRRTLSHLSALSSDLSELGAKYNAFALSEQDPTLGPVIERIGQAVDMSYVATEELSSSLGASFAEPMRENAQFVGVVRNVLKYRVLKRVQQEMTNDELNKKRALLDQLERSEAEARRIDQYLSGSQQIQQTRRSTSSQESPNRHRREGSQEDTASIDSDFPPTHGDISSAPSAKIGSPERTSNGASHKKVASGNSITNKIFGPIRHAIQGVADVDPEKTRRDTIGRTRESIAQLEQAQVAVAQDVKDASASVLKDMKRFQREKEDDLRKYMVRLNCPHLHLPLRSITNVFHSLPMPRVRSSGQRRIRRRGRMREQKSTRLMSPRRTVLPELATTTPNGAAFRITKRLDDGPLRFSLAASFTWFQAVLTRPAVIV